MFPFGRGSRPAGTNAAARSFRQKTSSVPRTRRGRGEGGIRQRADGLWEGVLSLGHDPRTGKRDRRSVYAPSKTAALAALEQLRTDVAAGKVQPRGRAPRAASLGAFLDTWLADTVKPGVSPATYRTYELAVRRHIKPAIGALKLERVTPADVQHLHAVVAAKPVGARTRQAVHVTLRRALGHAQRWGQIAGNPAALVDAPRYTAGTIRPLSAADAGKLLVAARGDRLEALYTIALATGMREGELFGLQWFDVDLETSVLHVRRALRDGPEKHRPELAEPKTRASRRRIPLGKRARAALDRHRKRMMAEGHGATYVFCDSDGGPLRRSNFLRRHFLPLLEKAGLERVRFHDLRHTTATLMLRRNVHPKVVQELLGHARISTTLDTYSHAIPTMQSGALRALEADLTAAVRKAKSAVRSAVVPRRRTSTGRK